MDLLTITLAGVRRDVRSMVYHSALQRLNSGCFGFLLGGQEEFTRPVFDLALVVKEIKTGKPFNFAPDQLETKLAACRQVAAKAETKVIGLFVAWDDFIFCDHRHERFGEVLDTARRMELPYVAEFSTLGHESGWGINIYFVNRFPHERLPYKMLPRRSRRAEHNPRRLLQLWKSLMAQT